MDPDVGENLRTVRGTTRRFLERELIPREPAVIRREDAVTIGARSLAATEVTAHAAYERRVVESRENSTPVAFAGNAGMGGAWRVVSNATAPEVQRRWAEGPDGHEALADLTRGTLSRDVCYRDGDTGSGMLSMDVAARFVNRVEPMAAIIEGIMAEAAACRARPDGLVAAEAPV